MRTRLVSVLTLLSAIHVAAAPTVTTSASARVFLDTNLYLQSEAPLAAGQVDRPMGPNEAAAGVDATLGVTLGWKEKAHEAALELGYAPEIVRYFDHALENHRDHTVTLAATGRIAGWATEIKGRYLYVDGSDEAPIFNALGGTPAIGGEPVRARRTQAITRLSGKTTRTTAHGFTRGVFSVFDQQFHTREQNVPWYCNYADRNESSIGLDAGWRGTGQVAAVVGVRTGVQRQANVLGVPLNFSNRFMRYLAGFEGSPSKNLKCALLVGPTVHRFGDSVRAGYPHVQSTGYGEASATYTVSARDTLALTAKRYLWYPGSGRGVFADGLVDVSWKRKVTPTWSTAVGANYHSGDTSHFNAWAPRRDRIYTLTAGTSFNLGGKLRLDLDVLHDWGVSLLPNVPGREYQRWILATTVARSW